MGRYDWCYRGGNRYMKRPLLTPWLHQKRTEIIIPFVKGDILDIGCGSADIANIEGIEKYYGIELDMGHVETLKNKYPEHSFFQMNLDVDEFPDKRCKFDTIAMIAVIEHLKNPDKILSQIPSLLKEEGWLVITTPSPLGDRIHKIGAMLGLTAIEAVEDHESIYGLSQIKELLNRNGLEVCAYIKFIVGFNQLVVCKKVNV